MATKKDPKAKTAKLEKRKAGQDKFFKETPNVTPNRMGLQMASRGSERLGKKIAKRKAKGK